ncbi:MAG: acyl-ACP desaturase [Gemmataceae bacterium]|nr:acyl-ACP desaturase [Gemmataceae bacterium]
MAIAPAPQPLFVPEIEREFWKLYREFFDKAERKRRWRVADDIPWDQCNAKLDPAVADIVESFTAIELYLPDYNAKILPVIRSSKGRAWFYANWGYEESKHSLALGDWLLRSGHRTEKQMEELERRVFSTEWNLPEDNHLGMLVYAMVQERATWLNYRNLRQRASELGGDGALETILKHVSVDEMAHHGFFRDCVALYLKLDRTMVLEAMRSVMLDFKMPAINDLLDNNVRRLQQIYDLKIFDESAYYAEVFLPILQDLGVDRTELRRRNLGMRSVVVKP